MSRKEKKCSKCKEEKLILEFCKNKSKKDGMNNECRSCRKMLAADYLKTKEGVSTALYSAQRVNSKLRGYSLPDYSKDEFSKWLFNQVNFKTLFKEWEMSGYEKYYKPSVDRIDNYKSYTFDNIQLMTWREHLEKTSSDIYHGINTKTLRAVISIDDKGCETEYFSMSEAERQTGISSTNIFQVCSNQKYHHSAGGYKWKFKN